ncbi:hypothetical protein SRO_1074 [Streptomyces rochei]|nr:hypothetical protein SRO_1074 [Streptomyces rochei]
MAHTFEELAEMQKATDAAKAQLEQLRDQYGPPTARPWSEQQTQTYETAWRSWRDLARSVQAAVTEHAKASGQPRVEVEAGVRSDSVRHGQPGAHEFVAYGVPLGTVVQARQPGEQLDGPVGVTDRLPGPTGRRWTPARVRGERSIHSRTVH